MARKKPFSTKNQTAKAKDAALQSKADREDKIINSMANTSVILMSTMMGAFTQVIVNATEAMASGMAEAVGGKEAGDKVNEEIKQKLPEVDEKMKAMISEIRKDIYSQMRQKRQELEPLLSDPAFEAGPKIIEKYDFKLPKLTQELDDNALAQYSQLLVSEDIRFAKMFKELTKWINSLPKPQRASQHKT
jgi:F0F1-type ATP synthase membrane subunit b/b'